MVIPWKRYIVRFTWLAGRDNFSCILRDICNSKAKQKRRKKARKKKKNHSYLNGMPILPSFHHRSTVQESTFQRFRFSQRMCFNHRWPHWREKKHIFEGGKRERRVSIRVVFRPILVQCPPPYDFLPIEIYRRWNHQTAYFRLRPSIRPAILSF